MGFYSKLEVDNGDMLRILRPDGTHAGKALTNFQIIYYTYDDFGEESQEFRWFSKLENLTRSDISILNCVIYSGDWDYDEHEYERFKSCAKRNPFKSEEEFQKAIRAIYDLWQPIDKMILMTQEILRVLPEMGGDDKHWYSPKDTPAAFQGLLNTLLLAKERGGEEVRIKVY